MSAMGGKQTLAGSRLATKNQSEQDRAADTQSAKEHIFQTLRCMSGIFDTQQCCRRNHDRKEETLSGPSLRHERLLRRITSVRNGWKADIPAHTVRGCG